MFIRVGVIMDVDCDNSSERVATTLSANLG